MTKCIAQKDLFQPIKSRKIDVAFDGGCVTSDAGVLLLRQADQLIDLTQRVARIIPDKRRQKSVLHAIQTMIQQRVYGLLWIPISH